MNTTHITDDEAYGLQVEDYVVFAVSLFLSLGIGLFFALKSQGTMTTSSYLVGNRKLNFIPVTFSLVVSFESAMRVLGYPAEYYLYGLQYTAIFPMMLPIVLLVGSRIIVPLFHPLKVTSMYEYLELRYTNRTPRYVGTCIGMLYQIFYIGVNLYGPAIALAAVSGNAFPTWMSIVVMCSVAVLYTSVGGIRAVIWTDVLQFTILMIGFLAVIIKTCQVAGGLGEVWKINDQNWRIKTFEFDPDPTIRQTFWSLFFGGLFTYQSILYNQSTVQRIASVKTRREATLILLIAGPMFGIVTALVAIECMGIFAYFNIKRCDPLGSGQIQSSNQIAPFAVLRMFRDMPGLVGLFIASLFSAALSTISSSLSSLSAHVAQDFLRPFVKSITERRITLFTKISVVCFGIISAIIAFIVGTIESSLTQICVSLFLSFGGPLGGLFMYSIFCPCATSKGATIGTVTGMVFIFWVSMGQSFSPTLPKLPPLPSNPTDMCQNYTSPTVDGNITYFHVDSGDTTSLEYKRYIADMENYENTEISGLDHLYAVSYTLFGMIGFLITVTIGIVVSLITGYPKPASVDTRYTLSIAEVFFPFLPAKIKRFLEFGLDFNKRSEWLSRLNMNDDSGDKHEQKYRVDRGSKDEEEKLESLM